MPKTAFISARIHLELKHNADEVFRELGLTATQAITLSWSLVPGLLVTIKQAATDLTRGAEASLWDQKPPQDTVYR